MTVSADPIRIFIVDDDQAVARSLSGLLSAHGIETTSYASAEEFLAVLPSPKSACMLLDLRMPGMNGLALQAELNSLEYRLPIVMLTGHGDVPAAVKAMKLGAIDFLEKPSSEEQLLDAVHGARLYLQKNPKPIVPPGVVARRLKRLTTREHEILQYLVQGLTNKQVASELEISQRTVEIHRARIRQKMRAEDLSDLIRMMQQ
ncbi:MAG: response regulator [Methyloceanibacter sp.]|uniref:response regulator transcription factor n=1 Tax=Methyloceanibacter sp. TaxID=1965321 RepID=UPI003C3A5AC0